MIRRISPPRPTLAQLTTINEVMMTWQRRNMKAYTCLVVLAVGLVAGCQKKSEEAPAALRQSFQQAQPEVQKEVQKAGVQLQSGNVVQALRTLAPVTERQDLTPQQRAAIAATLTQVNKAIAANPQIETPETYALRQKMFQAVYGRKRF